MAERDTHTQKSITRRESRSKMRKAERERGGHAQRRKGQSERERHTQRQGDHTEIKEGGRGGANEARTGCAKEGAGR